MNDVPTHVIVVRCRACGETVTLDRSRVVYAAELSAFVAAHEHDQGNHVDVTITPAAGPAS